MRSLTFLQKYNAMLHKDSSYEGIFVTAVKTTGVFCRPVCSARKPKVENVEFFDSPEQAIMHGYRACQVCKPMEQANKTPAYIQAIINEVVSNPEIRLKDQDLRKRNIEPNSVRRWFKKHHNMSFQAFQRMLRINKAFSGITTGEKITASAFDSGYNSLSGFNESFRAIIGKKPTDASKKNIITITRFTTPLGPMYACATKEGLCLLEFTNRRMLEKEFDDLKKRLNAVILPGKNVHLAQTEKEMAEYFDGIRETFTVPIHAPGTDFQKRVWEALREIPYGETRSYKRLAIELGMPLAIRAVASANGFNRIAIIIPCHRIIGGDGQLTGYGGGLARKKWMIDFEKKRTGLRDM